VRPVLGVEGGGSHSHAVVADVSGTILGVGKNDDPSNWEDVGIVAASGAIRSCVAEALGAAGIEPAAITASVFGLAGIDFPIDEQRLGGIPPALRLSGPSSLVNDAFVALRAGTDRPYGVVIVAGTGSVVAGRNAGGRVFRTLGLGPMFGDWGGGSEVPEAGVRAVADAFVGTGPATALTELLRDRTRASSVTEFLETAARGGLDVTVFSPLIFQAAHDGEIWFWPAGCSAGAGPSSPRRSGGWWRAPLRRSASSRWMPRRWSAPSSWRSSWGAPRPHRALAPVSPLRPARRWAWGRAKDRPKCVVANEASFLRLYVNDV
jgi:N-acetylglucosamine kinase-like BadF-type ATPase